MLDIHKKVEAFLSSSGMAPSTFGRRVKGDKNLVKRLRDGRDVTTATAELIETFIARHSAQLPQPPIQTLVKNGKEERP